MNTLRRSLFAAFVLLPVFFLVSCMDKTDKGGQLPELCVACLGDSITHGYKLGDPDHESYPARLAMMSNGRWHVLNCGHNGATVTARGDLPISTLEEYQRALRAHPDVIVVMLGTNDAKNANWRHIDDFVQDYTVLIRDLQDLPSRPRVIVCSIPPVFNDYPNGITAHHEEKINTLIDAVVTQTGVEFIDIFAVLDGHPALFIDGVHHNAAGAEKIAAKVYAFIAAR
jgi:sialate O-acetylesterase